MTHAPRSIAILGGGPIGCAFAQFFARLGARVTLFQTRPSCCATTIPTSAPPCARRSSATASRWCSTRTCAAPRATAT